MAGIKLVALINCGLALYAAYALSGHSIWHAWLIGIGIPGTLIAGMFLLGKTRSKVKVLDSSVLIDGRIVDLCKTGFLEGELIIPDFIVGELNRIAQTGDESKSNRGKRGLDTIAALKRLTTLKVSMIKSTNPKDLSVEKRLLSLVKKRSAMLMTNDGNINKSASIQGIPVLNINELSNAMKSIILPGETLRIRIIKEGKEKGQGVGYLNDGTMVVVEQGYKQLNNQVAVVATSVLQTAAGRMIFAKM